MCLMLAGVIVLTRIVESRLGPRLKT